MSLINETPKELTVTFQPPLYLQRRGWVFDILRREGVREVLDIGCGEGELISCLCNPAPWLLAPPSSVLQACATPQRPGGPERFPLILPECDPAEGFMHPVRVLALDISSDDLQSAVEYTAPRRTPSEPDMLDGPIRWEPLEVKIWEGGLECVNPEFIDVECIVSTEVIEHLPEGPLQDFAPVLLGLYHPRLLLITTPSYTFNARFTPPDAPAGVRSGYLDPTGRTTRIFRHNDHKFEWTTEEFTQWCTRVAEEWGYDVEVRGVGKAEEKDEWGRDEELGWASQVAAFTRREGEEHARARRRRCESSGILKRAGSRTQHSLLATHLHLAHEKTQQPGSLHAIGELVKARMFHYRESTMCVSELWAEHDIGILCGGWIELLVQAVEEHTDLCLDKSEASEWTNWKVELPGTHATKRDVWLAQDLDEAVHAWTSQQSSDSQDRLLDCHDTLSWDTTLPVNLNTPQGAGGQWSPDMNDEWGAPDVSKHVWGSTEDWGAPITSLVFSA